MKACLIVLLFLACAPTANATTLHGFASTYANDPITGYVDHADNNTPTLPGASNDNPGIAVYNRRTLGGYWRMTSPTGTTKVVQQTDLGPNPDTDVTFDINAVAARSLFHYEQGDYFPTKQGVWTGRYLGKTPPTAPVVKRVQPDPLVARAISWYQQLHPGTQPTVMQALTNLFQPLPPGSVHNNP